MSYRKVIKRIRGRFVLKLSSGTLTLNVCRKPFLYFRKYYMRKYSSQTNDHILQSSI